MNRGSIVLRRGIVAFVLSTTVAIPSPAQSAEQCVGPLGTVNPITVGVAGEPVASVPATNIGVCVRVGEGPGLGAPEPYVECSGRPDFTSCYNEMAVYLRNSDFSFVEATVTYSVAGNVESETVRIPGTGDGGPDTCLFFYGLPADNPGQCLVFVER